MEKISKPGTWLTFKRKTFTNTSNFYDRKKNMKKKGEIYTKA